ncbi:MAG: single-stranded DNA-binding protein [Planctomycetota bacterium]
MNFNRVFLLGNLTRDVETRQAGSSTVASIGMAVNRKYRTSGGEDREEVLYVDIEAWGRQAEVLAQYVGKGDPLFIEGRLKLDQWDDGGETRRKMKVVLESFQFIGSGREGQKPASSRRPAETVPAGDIDPDEIPF